MGFENDKEKRLKDALSKAFPVRETKSDRFRSLLERLSRMDTPASSHG